MKFTQLAKSLKEAVAPVYLIEGEEAYFRDSAVNAVRNALRITQPLLNDVRYEGETLKGDRLASFRDELYTLPMFDEKRLVRVYGLYLSEREFSAVLEPYLKKPCLSTVLCIVNAGKKPNTADLRKKSLTFVDCGREDEETLTRWLFSLMRKKGLDPDADACALMVKYCALNASRMKTETEKLKALLGEGGRVTAKTVEAEVAKDAEYKIYELTQAASGRNFAKFSEVLQDLLRKGSDEYSVISSLTSHYRTLSEIANFKGTDAEIEQALSIKSYPLKKNRELIASLGKARVEELYLALYELGAGARSGKYTKTGALSEAIARIFFRA